MNAQLDLLYSILDPNATYPWNPYGPESEVYFAALEASWPEADEADEAAIAAGWQQFSQQLNRQWPAAAGERVAALVQSLGQRFSVTPPEQMLTALAEQAIALATSGRPLIEQLVQCARSIMDGWDEGDLEVLARPLAYSLRDGRGEMLALHMQALQQCDWATLSDLERARLSLTLASVALNEVAATSDNG